MKRWSDGTPIAAGEIPDPWGVRPADRWVRVMAEICSGGLWDRSGGSRHADDLPIPPDLVARIERWQAWHDELDDDNLSFPKPMYWEQRPDAPLAAFNAEGRAIAVALKAALPSDWTVIAVDVDAWLRTCEPVEASELILRGNPAVHDGNGPTDNLT
jgi:hypothetical protein